MSGDEVVSTDVPPRYLLLLNRQKNLGKENKMESKRREKKEKKENKGKKKEQKEMIQEKKMN